MSYSFNPKEEALATFIETLKQGCFSLYEALKARSFESLLHEISEATRAKKPGFFKDLARASNIITQAFAVIRENKIKSFDRAIVLKLVWGTQEDHAVMLARPKIVDKPFASVLNDIHLKLISEGHFVQALDLYLGRPLESAQLAPFEALGIANLLPI